MFKRINTVNITMVVIIVLVANFLLAKCVVNSTKPETIEVEKVVEVPIETIKTIEVEKPVIVEKVVEKIVYIEPPKMEYESENTIYTETELTESKATELLETNNIFCYYVLSETEETRSLRLRNIFKKGDCFIRFENMGKYPIIYSIIEL